MGDVNCQMPLNPDIGGIGVRIALYIQITLCAIDWVTSMLWPRRALNIFTATTCTLMYFLVAALAQAKSGTMSDLDCYVINMFSLLNNVTNINPQLIRHIVDSPRGRGRPTIWYCLNRAAGFLLAITYTIIWSVWLRVVYLRPVGSGPDSADTECSPSESFVTRNGLSKFQNARKAREKLSPSYLREVFLAGIFCLLGVDLIYNTLKRLSDKSSQEVRGNGIGIILTSQYNSNDRNDSSSSRNKNDGSDRSDQNRKNDENDRNDKSNNNGNKNDNNNTERGSSTRNANKRDNGAESRKDDTCRLWSWIPRKTVDQFIQLWRDRKIIILSCTIAVFPLIVAIDAFIWAIEVFASPYIPTSTAFQTLRNHRAFQIIKNYFPQTFFLLWIAVTFPQIPIQIEATIAANNVSLESKQWSFGQIPAFCGGLGAVICTLYNFTKKWIEGEEGEKGDALAVDIEWGGGLISASRTYGRTGAVFVTTTKIKKEREQKPTRQRRGCWKQVIKVTGERHQLIVLISRRTNRAENKHVFTVQIGNLARMWRGDEKMWRSAFFVPSRDPALPFSPRPPPLIMDSLSLLRESLPNAKLETAEREMSMDFKAAAQSLATLFKSSKQTAKYAHDAGYAACLQDMLQLIQSGLSEDADVGVAQVMDWADGQLDRYRDGLESEKVDESIVRHTIRDDNRSPRRASTSSLPELAPLDTTATKRRLVQVTSEARRRLRMGPLPGERDIRTPKRMKRAVPSERERERMTDGMEFEDDGGRDRKRSRVVNGTPPS